MADKEFEIVVATLNVSFDSESDSAGGALKLEIDDRKEGLNAGETSFKPGDKPGFWMFADSNVDVIVSPRSTSGGVTRAGSDSKDVDENITFSNSDTGSLNYPPNSDPSMEWLGRSYRIEETKTGVKVTPNTALPTVKYSTLTMPKDAEGKTQTVIGLLNCKYVTSGSLHRLDSVAEDIEEVVIFAVGIYEKED